eukprot:463606-Prymnesium_polylepis.1
MAHHRWGTVPCRCSPVDSAYCTEAGTQGPHMNMLIQSIHEKCIVGLATSPHGGSGGSDNCGAGGGGAVGSGGGQVEGDAVRRGARGAAGLAPAAWTA